MADGWGGALVPTAESTSSGMGLNLSQQQATNQAQNFSNQSAFNNAFSNSFIPDYSQTPILERIAQEAENYAPQVYNWGIDAYERNQHSIDDLMRAGQMWASPQHIATMMGQAEAGVQQAGEQARQSAIQDLQSYGIDPSSGRYAALDNAMRVQTAAAAAGAGDQQRSADIDRGITMQNQAMSAGMQNTQIGYGAANALNSLYGTGMQLKYSPLGQTSTSTGGSSGFSTGSSSGQSTGEGFGINQQTSQSQQQQPVNVIKNVGTMVARGGYIGHDHVEHPDDVKGYDFGGPVAGRLSGPVSSAPMNFPSRPFMNPSTPMPSMAAMRASTPRLDFSTPQAAYGSMHNLDTMVQSGIRGLPGGVQGQAEGMYERTRDVMPRMLGFQEGGMVMDDPIARYIEEQTGMSPEAINRARSYEAGGVGEESGGYQEGGEVNIGGDYSGGGDYTGDGGGDGSFQMAGDYGIPGAGPRQEDYPVQDPRGTTPEPKRGDDDWKKEMSKPPTGTQEIPTDVPTPRARPPEADQPQTGDVDPDQPRPKYRGPTGPGSPNYVPPDNGGGQPSVTLPGPGWTQRPNPNDPGKVIVTPPSGGGGPTVPDPTTKQFPPANIPPGHPLYQPPQGGGGGGGGSGGGGGGQQQRQPSPDDAPGGRYRAYTPISLVASRPAGYNARDPMTGEWLQIDPAELAPQEDASITGRFGRRLAEQTSLGAAQMLANELERQRGSRRRRGYAGGGVVGTTSAGFTPSGPVGGAPISPGAPSFTSGMPRGMAGGGPVAPTTGGFVSQALSPSRGGQVDDVPARLNEGEYVIPRDVVQFKGKEFFHRLIAQSRKNREAHQRSMFDGGHVGGEQAYG